jgi:hypothetical protein
MEEMTSGQESEIGSLLAEAAQDVDSAGIPQDLRVAAFSKAVDLRAAKAGLGGNGGSEAKGPGERRVVEGGLGARLGVDDELLGELAEIGDNRVDLIFAPSLLPRQKAAAMRDVALLVASIRQAAGVDSEGWTAAGVIREQCREVGVLDQANFATELGKMGAFFSFRGSGRSREVRVNRRGFEEAGRRMVELARGGGQ